jgi:hypothetical protein
VVLIATPTGKTAVNQANTTLAIAVRIGEVLAQGTTVASGKRA